MGNLKELDDIKNLFKKILGSDIIVNDSMDMS
jgi:hypothetical protein